MSKPNFYLKLADMIIDMIDIDIDLMESFSSTEGYLDFDINTTGTQASAEYDDLITATLTMDENGNPRTFRVHGARFTYVLQDISGSSLDWVACEKITFHVESTSHTFTRTDGTCRFGTKSSPNIEVKNHKLILTLRYAQLWATLLMLRFIKDMK